MPPPETVAPGTPGPPREPPAPLPATIVATPLPPEGPPALGELMT